MTKPRRQLRATLTNSGASSLVTLVIRNHSEVDAFLTSYNLPSEDGVLENGVFEFGDNRPRFLGRLAKRGLVQETDCIRLGPGAEYQATVDIARWYALSPGQYEVAYLAFHDFPPTLEATALRSNQQSIQIGGAP